MVNKTDYLKKALNCFNRNNFHKFREQCLPNMGLDECSEFLMLLSHKKNVTFKNRNFNKWVDEIYYSKNLDFQKKHKKYGAQALWYFGYRNNVYIVNCLLNLGANVNVKPNENKKSFLQHINYGMFGVKMTMNFIEKAPNIKSVYSAKMNAFRERRELENINNSFRLFID